MRLRHRVTRELLADTLQIPPSRLPAFNARLKYLLSLGLIPDRREGGHWQRYRLADIFEMAIAVQLERCFVAPGEAVRFIVESRDSLRQVWWRSLIKGDSFSVSIRVDALALEADSSPRLELQRGHHACSSLLPVLVLDISHLIDRIVEQVRSHPDIDDIDVEHDIHELGSR